MADPYTPLYQRAFYLMALIVLLCTILVIGSSFFIPLVLGAFLAMVLVPVTALLERFRMGKFLPAALPILLAIVGVFVTIALAGRQITEIMASVNDSEDRITRYMNRIDSYLQWNFNLEESVFPELDGKRVINLLKQHSGSLLLFMGGLAGPAFSAFLVPIFGFFFLYYREHLLQFLVLWLRNTPAELVEAKANQSQYVARNYLVGIGKVVAILAVFNSAALLLIGVENAIFFGVFAAFLNIIPYLGPALGSILPTLYVLLTEDSLYYPAAVLGLFMLIQAMESNFLTPKIVGNNVRLNPFVTFASLIAGGLIWGIIGMIIIIPVMAILMQLFNLSEKTRPFAFLLGRSR